MEILHAELPSTEVSIHSQDSPDLAAGLTHGKIDLAFMRPEKQTVRLKYRLLRKDPLIVLMPRDHAWLPGAPFARRTSWARYLSECPRSGHRPRGCYHRLPQAPRRKTPPSGRESGDGDFAGGVHRRHRPASALFSNLLPKPSSAGRYAVHRQRSIWSSAITRRTHRRS